MFRIKTGCLYRQLNDHRSLSEAESGCLRQTERRYLECCGGTIIIKTLQNFQPGSVCVCKIS